MRSNAYQPVTELVVSPGAIDGIGGAIVVSLELFSKLVTVLLVVRFDNAVIDEPLVLKVESG